MLNFAVYILHCRRRRERHDYLLGGSRRRVHGGVRLWSDTKAVDLDADGRFLYLALPIRPSLVYHRDLMTRHGFPTSYCPFYLSLPASFSSFPYTAVPTLNEPTLLLPPALSSRAPLRNQTLMHRDSIFDAWLMFPDRLMDCALPSISDVHPANLRNFAPLHVYGILRHAVLRCAATPRLCRDCASLALYCWCSRRFLSHVFRRLATDTVEHDTPLTHA